MALVKVTNRNNTVHFRDKYGGIEYKFPCGDTVTIPEEAATHIWGWGLSDPERHKKMQRIGLANRKDGKRIWENVVLRSTGKVEPTGKEREVVEE